MQQEVLSYQMMLFSAMDEAIATATMLIADYEGAGFVRKPRRNERQFTTRKDVIEARQWLLGNYYYTGDVKDDGLTFDMCCHALWLDPEACKKYLRTQIAIVKQLERNNNEEEMKRYIKNKEFMLCVDRSYTSHALYMVENLKI